ncbi:MULTISPECIES: hypothetical protein [unclassified Aureimonas]|uniref:hypothetical protein n=1 Tax=unclassified Aureimonas TaxID=2615206 RepID=UPI0012E379E1|nr:MULTISPECIES: hypothetical protein [unclassified Aureimonas]
MRLTVVMICVSAALNGCVSAGFTDNRVAELRASEVERNNFVEVCNENLKFNDAGGPAAARELKVKPTPEGSRIVCERMLKGLISGRVTQKDFDVVTATGSPPRKLAEVMMGR